MSFLLKIGAPSKWEKSKKDTDGELKPSVRSMEFRLNTPSPILLKAAWLWLPPAIMVAP